MVRVLRGWPDVWSSVGGCTIPTAWSG